MPQLDPNVFLPQIFWLFIIFGLIYLFIAYSAAPRITQVLEKRADRISSDLEAAESLQAQAEKAREAYDLALEDARVKATSTVTIARETIKTNVEAEYNKLTARLHADAEAAEAKISSAKDNALDEVRAMSSDICQEIIRRVSHLDLEDKIVAGSVAQKFDGVKGKANG